MARSSTGLPYLIRRPDNTKYAYWRELPADLVPHVKGDLALPWSTTPPRVLDGTARVLKLSLKTGDEATARVRWTHVHAQVEALVQRGRVLHHEQADRDRDRLRNAVERLPPEAIPTIAAQARHDLLAEHDRTWIDPTFTSPLTGVIVDLMRKAEAVSGGATVRKAQGLANDVLLREATRNLVDRGPGLFDAEIVEAELDVDPAILDLDALRRGAVRRLTPAQMAHLNQASVVGRVPGEVEARLAENGFGLPGAPDRRALALALLRTRVSGLRDIQAREAGDAISTPPRPAPTITPPEPPPSKPSLSSMLVFWTQDKRPGDKEVADRVLYLRYFTDLFGDRPVDQITAPMLAEFLVQLELCPRNVPHGLRRGRLQDRVAWGARPEHRGKPRLKRPTINSKGLGSVSALMEQARKLGHVVNNPCDGMGLTIKPGDVVKRVAYSLEDLRRIFALGAYAPVDPGRAVILRGADQWLPLLGLYTGARLEELGQLLVSDAVEVDRVPCLQITDMPDEDADLSADASKAIKTAAGHRLVPIHAALIRCGFLNFVEEQRSRGMVRLFPELPRYRGRVTKEFSKAYARRTDKHVTRSPTKTFHSFRHLFIAKLRAIRVDPFVIKALVGHAIRDVTLGYGVEDGSSPFSIEVLDTALQQFMVAGLDISHLHHPAPLFMMTSRQRRRESN